MSCSADPPRRPNESKSAYAARTIRWQRWKKQEPLVDLACVSDTEVAEYRAWAKTTGWHDRIVDELIELVGGEK